MSMDSATSCISRMEPIVRQMPLEQLSASPVLPPIPSTSNNVKFATNPVPLVRTAADLGSLVTIGDLTELDRTTTTDSISHSSPFEVCKHCESSLLGAFNHCLSKHGDYMPLDSTHEIDEVADARLQSNPPYFDIISDPTAGSNTQIVDGPKQKIDRDRWVNAQNRNAADKLDLGLKSQPKIKGLGIKSGKSFSGAIYKRMLDAKEREITSLRKQLYQVSQREMLENENVHKLKRALNKSVRYYSLAEEWQQDQSLKLQEDVKRLKGEVSTLIAFLINSEVQKQNLTMTINELHAAIKSREEQAREAIAQAEEMKLKLQDSYKEIIEMNSTIVVLRKEAQRGTDAVEARNIMLQKNLGKLTADFEVSSKDLRTANSRIRELDYELEQMIIELNTKGESLKRSSALNIQLKTTVESTTLELKELQKNHEQLILQKAKVEADARNEKLRAEQIQTDLKKSLERVNVTLEQTKQAKADLETYYKVAKAETAALTKRVNELIAERDELTESLNRAKQSAKTEISTRDLKIADLNNKISKDQVTIKTLQDKKEQLVFQVTDLENNLEMETAAAKQATDELQQLKRETELKINNLTEQVEKLTTQKATLALDKKELQDRIKVFRKESLDKDAELEELHKKFADFQSNSANEIAGLEKNVASLNEDLKLVNKNLQSLRESYTESVETNLNLTKTKETLEKNLTNTENELLGARLTLTQYQKDKEELSKELWEWKAKHADLTRSFDALTEGNVSVIGEYANYKAMMESLVQERNVEIQGLNFDLDIAKKSITSLETQNQDLSSRLFDTQNTLTDTLAKLAAETHVRETLELQLDENRRECQYEKRLRRDLERLHSNLKFGDLSRHDDSMSDWKIREKRLNEVVVGLSKEALRLSEMVALLPKEEEGGMGNESEFVLPTNFNRKEGKKGKKPS